MGSVFSYLSKDDVDVYEKDIQPSNANTDRTSLLQNDINIVTDNSKSQSTTSKDSNESTSQSTTRTALSCEVKKNIQLTNKRRAISRKLRKIQAKKSKDQLTKEDMDFLSQRLYNSGRMTYLCKFEFICPAYEFWTVISEPSFMAHTWPLEELERLFISSLKAKLRNKKKSIEKYNCILFDLVVVDPKTQNLYKVSLNDINCDLSSKFVPHEECTYTIYATIVS